MDERRKHGWPFWFAAMAIALPILYFASFLGAVWLDNYDYLPDSIGPPLVWLYGPFIWCSDSGPEPLKSIVCWCADAVSP